MLRERPTGKRPGLGSAPSMIGGKVARRDAPKLRQRAVTGSEMGASQVLFGYL